MLNADVPGFILKGKIMGYIDWTAVWAIYDDWYRKLEVQDEGPTWEEQKRKIEELAKNNIIG